jgi:hypothetical protein
MLLSVGVLEPAPQQGSNISLAKLSIVLDGCVVVFVVGNFKICLYIWAGEKALLL